MYLIVTVTYEHLPGNISGVDRTVIGYTDSLAEAYNWLELNGYTLVGETYTKQVDVYTIQANIMYIDRL